MVHIQQYIMTYTGILSLFIFSTRINVLAWSTVSFNTFQTKRCTLEMKRGRGSLGKEVGGTGIPSSNGNNLSSKRGLGPSTSTSGGPVINWIPITASTKELPTEDNTVGIIDTNLPTMKVANTNPTGAVSVLKYKDTTYCFAINCPSCQIPLTKAKVIEPKSDSNDPRLVCDFCKATYNIKTGAKLESAVENPGILGGIAKSLFSAKNSGNLKTYALGERNGKLLIALD